MNKLFTKLKIVPGAWVVSSLLGGVLISIGIENQVSAIIALLAFTSIYYLGTNFKRTTQIRKTKHEIEIVAQDYRHALPKTIPNYNVENTNIFDNSFKVKLELQVKCISYMGYFIKSDGSGFKEIYFKDKFNNWVFKKCFKRYSHV